MFNLFLMDLFIQQEHGKEDIWLRLLKHVARFSYQDAYNLDS